MMTELDCIEYKIIYSYLRIGTKEGKQINKKRSSELKN